MSSYGKHIEKALSAIAWREDVMKELAQTKHILTITNGLIKHSGPLTPMQRERLLENREMLEVEIALSSNDLENDLASVSLYN